MKLKYLVAVATASIISVGFAGISTGFNFNVAVASCAGAKPCAGNPCASAAISNSAPLVYIESASGLAIRGTDPVAYFTEGKAVEETSCKSKKIIIFEA